jgi:hypothetical protein
MGARGRCVVSGGGMYMGEWCMGVGELPATTHEICALLTEAVLRNRERRIFDGRAASRG